MFYIYFLLNNDKQVIYIGQTNDMRKRMISHKSNKDWWNEVSSVKYSGVSSRFKLDLYEKYYVSKLMPIYNSDFVKEYVDFDIPDLTLQDYKFIEEYSFSDFDIKHEQKIKPKKKNVIVYATDDLISKIDKISIKIDCSRNDLILKMLEHCIKTFKMDGFENKCESKNKVTA